MPDFPIVDAHVHLWDPNHFRILWIDGAPALNKPFLIPEYNAHTKGVTVEAFVYAEVDVAPHYALQEARWVAERAREDGRLRGIIAHAPLEYGAQVRPFLKELTTNNPLVKGVRRLLQGEKDPAYALQARFMDGVQMLAEFGLSFDICINSKQVKSTIELVRKCPRVNFILDHIGKPEIKKQVLEPWAAEIKELAKLPNVVCKLSGMATEADHEKWTVADLKPYAATVLEAFGEDRVMFAGDWPVVTLASSYLRWVQTVDELTAGLSGGAKKKLWNENARKAYHF